jgi:glycosyltransferase involved in cell wall biosynthesis
MKVLIVTYYWPPSGGSGVQRWLKFVKYLPSFGITPYVFTPQNPSFDLRDESLVKDIPPEAKVIRFPIWEPFGGLGKTHRSESKQKSFSKKITIWLRGNLIYPDPRIFWVRPSVKFLNDFLKENNINTIITTGPPHSIHLIGKRLKKKNPRLKWVADFRDPWSEWGVLLSFYPSLLARSIHRRMERKVLCGADRVLTITPFYNKQLAKLSGRKINLIPNGFDESDFDGLQVQRTEKFTIRHVGLVNLACNPIPFMNAMKELIEESSLSLSHVEIIFTGQVNMDFMEFVKRDECLSKITVFQPHIQHSDLIKLYGDSFILLLILTGYKDGEGFLPGKLFEYLATGLPILATGPIPSDADDLIRDLNAGNMIASHDKVGLKKVVLTHYENWKMGQINNNKHPANAYSRKQLTLQLAEILKSF